MKEFFKVYEGRKYNKTTKLKPILLTNPMRPHSNSVPSLSPKPQTQKYNYNYFVFFQYYNSNE